MNIAGVNLTPVTTVGLAGDAVAMPLAVDGALPEGFTTALIAQLGLLNDLSSQAELAQTGPVAASVQSDVTLMLNAGLPAEPGEGQDLAALVGEGLPMSYDTDKTPDADAHLLAVTEAINYLAGQPKPEQPLAEPLPEAAAGDVVTVGLLADMQAEDTRPDTEIADDDQAHLHADQEKSAGSDAAAQAALDQAAILVSAPVSVMPGQSAVIDSTQPELSKNLGQGVKTAPQTTNAFLKNKDAPVSQDTDGKGEYATQIGQLATPQVSTDPKTSVDQPAALVELSESDSNTPKSIPAELAKLDKLAVNKDDVPAMTKPLNHPEWGKDMGDRIMWMNNKSLQAAEIKLNPQHLGPISVRIDVSQDQASVTFNAQHAVVRDALEASIPKLREMLNAQNLNLADVNVVAQHSSSNQGQSQSQSFAQTAKHQEANNLANSGDDLNAVGDGSEAGSVRVSQGLLSMYA